MKRFLTVFCIVMVACLGACLAVEVPAVTPLEFAVDASPEAHWIWDVLGGGIVASLAAALGKFLQGVISGIRDARVSRACQFVWAGTMTCYQEYVRIVKSRKDDGKLTVDEKNEALRYAYAKAVEIARTDGVDLVKTLGKEMILALIEKYVGESKAALAPLPDLGPSAPSV